MCPVQFAYSPAKKDASAKIGSRQEQKLKTIFKVKVNGIWKSHLQRVLQHNFFVNSYDYYLACFKHTANYVVWFVRGHRWRFVTTSTPMFVLELMWNVWLLLQKPVRMQIHQICIYAYTRTYISAYILALLASFSCCGHHLHGSPVPSLCNAVTDFCSVVPFHSLAMFRCLGLPRYTSSGNPWLPQVQCLLVISSNLVTTSDMLLKCVCFCRKPNRRRLHALLSVSYSLEHWLIADVCTWLHRNWPETYGRPWVPGLCEENLTPSNLLRCNWCHWTLVPSQKNVFPCQSCRLGALDETRPSQRLFCGSDESCSLGFKTLTVHVGTVWNYRICWACDSIGNVEGLQLLLFMAWPGPFIFSVWNKSEMTCKISYTETASLFCLNRFLLGSCILNCILLLRAAVQEEVFAHLQSSTEGACQSQVIPAGSFSRASHTPRPSDLQMGTHDVFDALIFCRFPFAAFAGQHKDTCRWGPLPHLRLSAMPVLPLLPLWGFHQASKSKERTWKRWIGGTTFMIYPNFKSN